MILKSKEVRKLGIAYESERFTKLGKKEWVIKFLILSKSQIPRFP